GVSPFWPSDRSACSSDRPASRPGTTPLSQSLAQVSRGPLPGGRESFFERLHSFGILLVGPGPGAHMREAQVLQGPVDGIVRDREAEFLVEPHDQITGPPSHHTVHRRDRPFLYQ